MILIQFMQCWTQTKHKIKYEIQFNVSKHQRTIPSNIHPYICLHRVFIVQFVFFFQQILYSSKIVVYLRVEMVVEYPSQAIFHFAKIAPFQFQLCEKFMDSRFVYRIESNEMKNQSFLSIKSSPIIKSLVAQRRRQFDGFDFRRR